MSGGPKYTVKVSNRDGTKREFVNYAGERVQDKYERIGVLFENKFGGFDLVLDKAVKLDPGTMYLSVFSNQSRAEREAPRRRGREKPADDAELGF